MRGWRRFRVLLVTADDRLAETLDDHASLTLLKPISPEQLSVLAARLLTERVRVKRWKSTAASHSPTEGEAIMNDSDATNWDDSPAARATIGCRPPTID